MDKLRDYWEDPRDQLITELERKINYLESQLKIQTEHCNKAEADLAELEDAQNYDN